MKNNIICTLIYIILVSVINMHDEVIGLVYSLFFISILNPIFLTIRFFENYINTKRYVFKGLLYNFLISVCTIIIVQLLLFGLKFMQLSISERTLYIYVPILVSSLTLLIGFGIGMLIKLLNDKLLSKCIFVKSLFFKNVLYIILMFIWINIILFMLYRNNYVAPLIEISAVSVFIPFWLTINFFENYINAKKFIFKMFFSDIAVIIISIILLQVNIMLSPSFVTIETYTTKIYDYILYPLFSAGCILAVGFTVTWLIKYIQNRLHKKLYNTNED